MNSVVSVPFSSQRRKDPSNLSAPRRASVQVVTGDVLAFFVSQLARARLPVHRITLVTPWISYPDVGPSNPLESVLLRADQDDAAVLLVTRPHTTESHAAAIAAVEAFRRGKTFLNHRLHAKLYVCDQGHGRGFAVIGSANMTRASTTLDEVAVVLRPIAGSPVITDFMPIVLRLARVRPRSRAISISRQRRPR